MPPDREFPDICSDTHYKGNKVVDEVEDTAQSSTGDFSPFRVSKANFLQQLEVVGAFSLLGIHPKALMEQEQKDDQNCHELESDSDSDLDYTDEGNEDKLTVTMICWTITFSPKIRHKHMGSIPWQSSAKT